MKAMRFVAAIGSSAAVSCGIDFESGSIKYR
jgi:hypothetical protein